MANHPSAHLSDLILSAVTEQPGISQAEIALRARVAVETANRALRALLEQGLLHRIESGGYCLPEHAPTVREPRPLPAVERRAAIVAWLETERVSPSQRELSRAFSCSMAVIQKDLRLLEAGGAVVNEGGRRGLRRTDQPWNEPVRREDSRRIWKGDATASSSVVLGA